MKASFKTDDVIARTLRTSVLIDAFWERWLNHGINRRDLDSIRDGFTSIAGWTEGWLSVSKRLEADAARLVKRKLYSDAEYMYRAASLGYNLIHWIHPDRNIEKRRWYEECLRVFYYADSLSPFETRRVHLDIENYRYSGRIRVPSRPVGCIIIINPIDSTKEELFSYEMDFNHAGFVTVSFDGPGQGETYTFNGLKGTKRRWECFVNSVIDFTASEFPHLAIHLFGTSLGASWAVYGSCNPLIRKTAAVSPAVEFERLQFPSYFLERMDYSCSLVPEERAIPDFNRLQFRSPVFLFHGKKDQMVPALDMYQLFEKLPAGKKIVEYDEEGHCCNNRLADIRQQALRWFALEKREESVK